MQSAVLRSICSPLHLQWRKALQDYRASSYKTDMQTMWEDGLSESAHELTPEKTHKTLLEHAHTCDVKPLFTAEFPSGYDSEAKVCGGDRSGLSKEVEETPCEIQERMSAGVTETLFPFFFVCDKGGYNVTYLNPLTKGVWNALSHQTFKCFLKERKRNQTYNHSCI